MKIDHDLYSVLGSAAMLTGVFKNSISVVVIMVEGTRGVNIIFAVVIAVWTSNIIMSLFKVDGVYESEIERLVRPNITYVQIAMLI